jgi:uncharacterized membrane protein YjgN (DUF898 family)
MVGNAFEWWGKLWAGALAMAIFGFYFPWWLCRFKTYLIERTSYGEQAGRFTARGREFFNIYFLGGLAILLFAIAAGGITFAIMRALHSTRWITLTAAPVYAAYVMGFAYIQARSANLVWNKASLGPLNFNSTLRGRDLAWLYLSNAVAILCTAGFAIPWAVMRTLRYRASRMKISLHGRLDEFRGSESSAVKAVGAELGEFFDLDVSL